MLAFYRTHAFGFSSYARTGLVVKNARGDQWRAYGDDNLLLPANERNMNLAREVYAEKK